MRIHCLEQETREGKEGVALHLIITGLPCDQGNREKEGERRFGSSAMAGTNDHSSGSQSGIFCSLNHVVCSHPAPRHVRSGCRVNRSDVRDDADEDDWINLIHDRRKKGGRKKEKES